MVTSLSGLITGRGLMFRLLPKDRRIQLDSAMPWTPEAEIDCWNGDLPQDPVRTVLIPKRRHLHRGQT